MSQPPWQGRRVLVALGTGGVGKTTVSAALAVAAAAAGRRTLVMTIDPARRLANALGLADVGNVAHRVVGEALGRAGLPETAVLEVMMPDVRGTFDRLVRQMAVAPGQAEAILAHPLYDHFASALAGSHEYAAIEQLFAAHRDAAYDLIVLDTPPAQNAMTFLEAPERVLGFLDHGLPPWLRRPSAAAGRVSARLLDMGGTVMFRALSRIAGAEILHQLADFLIALQDLYAGFRERAQAIQNLLRDDSLACLVVTAPSASQVTQVPQLAAALKRRGMQVRGTLVNRIRPAPPDDASAALAAHVQDAAARAALQHCLDEEMALSARDKAWVERLRELTHTPVVALPELDEAAHQDPLSGLARLAPHFQAF